MCFAELHILYSYMAIKCFSPPEPDYDCKSEITQRDGTNVSHSYVGERGAFVGDKAFNGFGDFVRNRYGSFPYIIITSSATVMEPAHLQTDFLSLWSLIDCFI